MNKTWIAVAASATAFALALTGCSSSSDADDKGNASQADSKSAKATSVADFGGMDGLIEAAKKEGEINVIALPDDWANYGQIKKAFGDKYGIKVNSITPDASSKEEIAAAETNKGTDKAPDVFDVGLNVAVNSTSYFAPYQVEMWDKIPADNKEKDGLYYNDYTGIMSVGYNATKFGEISSLDELTDKKFAATVAMNGKPAEAGSAFNAFLMLNRANGGDFNNLEPGMDFVKKLKQAGTLDLKDVTNGTIDSGQHGVVLDWTYNQLSHQKRLADKGVDWKIFVPSKGELAAYYNQAVNVDAPHPAAARLWMEYLYSAEGSNEWLRGGAMPVLFNALKDAGTLDTEAAAKLPELQNDPKTPSTEEAETITAYLAKNWDKALS